MKIRDRVELNSSRDVQGVPPPTNILSLVTSPARPTASDRYIGQSPVATEAEERWSVGGGGRSGQ